MKRILKETGLRNISALRKRYPKAEIYFHQDLDGVTTAIAMKKYLEDNGIKVVGAHVIQYGDKEFAVKKNDAKGDTMPVLVDFAHGKPMFVIHTDHHDKQIGAEKEASKSFRQARSNVETISQIVSPKDLFPSTDILLISTVDSADFIRQNVTPDEVVNYLYRFDKDRTLSKNKMLMGFVVNKLLLAFKNKKGFLENLVMDSEPSLLSILTNIKKWMKQTNAPKPEELQYNADDYAEAMKSFRNLDYQDGIITQYGGGDMRKPGSYDRYTPYRTYPDADFLIMAWPMGLLQVSCNPFKKNRGLKGVNLGEMAKKVLAKWESQLKSRIVPLSTIKWISETAVNPESVGFTFRDFDALYGEKFMYMEGGEEMLNKIKEMMDKPFNNLTEEEKQLLDKIGVTAWDIINSQSGGHKCITNISGLNYLGRSKRPPQGNYRYDPEKEDAPYIKYLKMLALEFKKMLVEEIKKDKVVSEQKIVPPKKTDIIGPDGMLNLPKGKMPNNAGFYIYFVFPAYRPSAEETWYNKALSYLGSTVEWFEDKLERLGNLFEIDTSKIKLYKTGHGGCILINKGGDVNLFEFGRYDAKGNGQVHEENLGKIAQIDPRTNMVSNVNQILATVKSKTFGDGPKLSMKACILNLPDWGSALQTARKKRAYSLIDIVEGGAVNCGTYSIEVAKSGGITDVSVGWIPEKPITVYDKFKTSSFFIAAYDA